MFSIVWVLLSLYKYILDRADIINLKETIYLITSKRLIIIQKNNIPYEFNKAPKEWVKIMGRNKIVIDIFGIKKFLIRPKNGYGHFIFILIIQKRQNAGLSSRKLKII